MAGRQAPAEETAPAQAGAPDPAAQTSEPEAPAAEAERAQAPLHAVGDEPSYAHPGLSQSLRAAAHEMLRLADELDRLVALLGSGVFGSLGATGGADPSPDEGLNRLMAAVQRMSGGGSVLGSYARLRGLLSQLGR